MNAKFVKVWDLIIFWNKIGIFFICAPQYVMRPPVTEHVLVNHYVKIWLVRLGGANNMRPLSWGGGGQTEKILKLKCSSIDLL